MVGVLPEPGAARSGSPGLRIVNVDGRYAKPQLSEPTSLGYVYVAASVRPSPTPFVLPSLRRKRVLARIQEPLRRVAQLDGVVDVTLFRALALPPTVRFSAYAKERGASLHPPRFDVMALIRTSSPAFVTSLEVAPAFVSVLGALRTDSHRLFVLPARNVRRIADVDTSSPGLFLFNHFVADDPAIMLELWEYLAGWYVAETGLDNSVALAAMAGGASEYTLVNVARWNVAAPRHFWHQLSKRSFWRYVVGNLELNRAVSMPVYCRLVAHWSGQASRTARAEETSEGAAARGPL